MKYFIFPLLLSISILFSCGKKTDETGKTKDEKPTEKKVTEKIDVEVFFKAVKDNDAAKVKEYISKDPTLVDAKTTDFLKETALGISTFNGYKEITELLIKNGANPNVWDDMGTAPLHGAARQNRSEIIQMLIDAKADVNIKHKSNDETPLHYAAEYNSLEAAQVLLKNGADKAAVTQSGKTAYDIAKDKKSDKVIDLLK
jgi:ankyrin repeat protein